MESMEGKTSGMRSSGLVQDGDSITNQRLKAASAMLRGNLRSNFARKGGIWQELSGSVGDIGTFLPILLAMSLVNGLSFGTTLIFTGVYNLITGGLFGVPMPVQPMKSIAAVAITQGDPLTVPQIMAAGITTSALLFFLGATGLMTLVQKFIPLSLVRGIQLSQGISFGLTAVKYIVKNQNLRTSKSTSDRDWTGSDGLLLALSAFFFVILVTGAGGSASSSNSAKSANTVKDEDQKSAHSAPGNELPITIDEGDQALPQKTNPSPLAGLRMRAMFLSIVPTALIIFIVGV